MIMGILGICGRMGNRIYENCCDRFEIIGIDIKQHNIVPTYSHLNEVKEKLDVLVDFSSTSSQDMLIEAINKKITIISGTTGYSLEQIDELKKLAINNDSKFYWSANFAKGIYVFEKLIDVCTKDFKIFDFVEIHATTKKDAPSGTAKMLAKKLGIEETMIQSLRLYQAPAIHEITFSSENERIIIRHEVINSKAFIMGFNEILNKLLGEEADVRRII